jgi:hypothetical protein
MVARRVVVVSSLPSPHKWSDIATHGRNIDLHPVCKFLHAGAKMADLHWCKNICPLIFSLPRMNVGIFCASVEIAI